MKIKNIITAAVAGASLLALAPGVSHAAAYDVDTVAAQTPGGSARGPVTWYDARGNGYASITVADTYAPDNACVSLAVRRRFQSGTTQNWVTVGTVCNGNSWTWNGAIGPNGSDGVRVLDVRVTRQGFNNSDIYSVSPGGA
jgi:hypothetical protein